MQAPSTAQAHTSIQDTHLQHPGHVRGQLAQRLVAAAQVRPVRARAVGDGHAAIRLRMWVRTQSIQCQVRAAIRAEQGRGSSSSCCAELDLAPSKLLCSELNCTPSRTSHHSTHTHPHSDDGAHLQREEGVAPRQQEGHLGALQPDSRARLAPNADNAVRRAGQAQQVKLHLRGLEAAQHDDWVPSF